MRVEMSRCLLGEYSAHLFVTTRQRMFARKEHDFFHVFELVVGELQAHCLTYVRGVLLDFRENRSLESRPIKRRVVGLRGCLVGRAATAVSTATAAVETNDCGC
jgi:hypothetical protein